VKPIRMHFNRRSANILCGRPLDLKPFKLQIGTPVTAALGNFHTVLLWFSCGASVFTSGACKEKTDRQTDGEDM